MKLSGVSLNDPLKKGSGATWLQSEIVEQLAQTI
jgi:hypothetical protein